MSSGDQWSMVPDVLDGLLHMFTAACPSAGTRLPMVKAGQPQEVAVLDGEPVSNLPPTYVLVGYSSTYSATAAGPTSALAVEGYFTATELSAGMVGGQQGESFKVWNEISSAVGDTDPAVPSRMRRAVADLFGACRQAVAADPTLQGAVQPPAYARIAEFRWLLDQAQDGYAVTIQFAVQIEGEGLVPY